jgi:hypothetical protein
MHRPNIPNRCDTGHRQYIRIETRIAASDTRHMLFTLQVGRIYPTESIPPIGALTTQTAHSQTVPRWKLGRKEAS